MTVAGLFLTISSLLSTLDGLGEECMFDYHCGAREVCHVSGTLVSKDCKSGICVCDAEHTQVGNKCKRNVYRGDTCTADDLCFGLMECINSVCQCAPGYEWEDKVSQCLLMDYRLIWESCTLTSDCEAGPEVSECRDNVCKCRSGYKPVNYRCRPALESEYCQSSTCSSPNVSSDVTTTNLQCVTNRCQCPGGFPQVVTSNWEEYCKKNGVNTLFASCNNTGDCTAALICDTCPGETDKRCLTAPSGPSSGQPVFLSSAYLLLICLMICGHSCQR